MSNLTGTKIKDTYPGLIKTFDSGPLGATASPLTDGLGNELPLQLSTTNVNFIGNVDFTGATVSGLPVSESGLIAGSAANSMQSAPALTLNPATASAISSIALGNGARATTTQNGIAIGTNSNGNGIAIGSSSRADANNIAIGNAAEAYASNNGIAIGGGTRALYSGIAIGAGHNEVGGQRHIMVGASVTQPASDDVIHIGNNVYSVYSFSSTLVGNNTGKLDTGGYSLGLGATAKPHGAESIAIGRGTDGFGSKHISIGLNAKGGTQSTAIGYGATASNTNCMAIGTFAISDALGSVAIGRELTASTVDTTTTRKLQLIDTVVMDYADDAAAATGGVPIGGIYHTSGVLKIRLV